MNVKDRTKLAERTKLVEELKFIDSIAEKWNTDKPISPQEYAKAREIYSTNPIIGKYLKENMKRPVKELTKIVRAEELPTRPAKRIAPKPVVKRQMRV